MLGWVYATMLCRSVTVLGAGVGFGVGTESPAIGLGAFCIAWALTPNLLEGPSVTS